MLLLLGGCSSAPFLVQDFQGRYKPKIQTVVLMPFEIFPENPLAEKNRQLLEESLTFRIARRDSAHAFVFPGGVRLGFQKSGRTDSALLALPPDTLGKIFAAQAVLYIRIIRLFESEGATQVTRHVRASRYARRGTELLVEFRLVDAASGKLFWRQRIGRLAEDVEAAVAQLGRAAAEAWPLQ
jgi:hypothetical protein